MPVRSLIPWAPGTTPALNLAIAKRAMCDIGICEDPPGSNRSGRINEYNSAAGVPAGSYWCASAVTAWWREAMESLNLPVQLPPGSASCDHWMEWAKTTRRWQSAPQIGAAVLYGHGNDAKHIGVIIRTVPLVLSIEGNTTVEGANFGSSRNGVAVSLKEVTKTDPVLGFVLPQPSKE